MARNALKAEGAQALLDAYPAIVGEAGWAAAARADARQRLLQTGAPVRRDEYWRYTDPADLTRQPAASAACLEDPAAFDGLDRVRLVFVDGVFAPDESDDVARAGIEIQTLREALRTDIHWAREIFGALEKRGQDPVARPLATLNTARAVEGLAIRVTGRAERPVHVIYRQRSEASDALIRHVVKMDAGADLALLESGRAGARANIVTEVDLADDASFHHVRSQIGGGERRLATAIFARLGREASFKSFTLTLGGRLTRNEAVLEFRGDNAHARVAGAAAGRNAFHHDDTVFITHDAQHCESRQVFKKVLDGGAVGVFQGKILVKPDAQKTDGYQISQGLLLDEASQFLTKPELEIYADDVVCSHGATCGPVDEDALFYLTSRGVPRAEAEALLVLAFLEEPIAEIEDERLAEDMRGRLARWMKRP